MAKALQKHTKGVHSLLADLLGKGQAAGAIDPTLDRHMTASLLISMIDGSRTLSLRDPKLDVKEATKALQTMIIRYLAPTLAQRNHLSAMPALPPQKPADRSMMQHWFRVHIRRTLVRRRNRLKSSL